jgi:hypothetical protein
MSDPVSHYVGEANPRTMFVEGPFGAGKTDFAIETLFTWLEGGVPAERVLVMVPQRTLARRYQLALRDAARGPLGDVEIRTLGGLALDAVRRYWTVVAAEAGFNEPGRPPRFLTIETAQYAMAEFVEEAVRRGEFDAINVAPGQIARQIIDNLGKAALMGIDYREIPHLLTGALGPERPRKQVLAYEAAGRVAQAYRGYCLEHRLLDYSLQLELFSRLLARDGFRKGYFGGHDYLIVEHLEEEAAVTHDLIRDWMPTLEGGLFTYEWDGGFRVFLGADPEGGYTLREACDGILTLETSYINGENRGLLALENQIAASLHRPARHPDPPAADSAFSFTFHSYYPQMLDWVAETIAGLVHEEGIPPREIVVLAPTLSDALRFSLGQKLAAHEIGYTSHRPSRALRDEPAARCLLTLTALAHPQWEEKPPRADVAQALALAISELDPVRARLLAEVVYRPGRDENLTPFEAIHPEMQGRITYRAGQRYDELRGWLNEYRSHAPDPLDHLFRRLFGEVLSKDGFGFHNDAEAGRVTAELVESAEKFRQALSTDARPDLSEVGRRYLSVVNQGLLAALYLSSWRDELADAVFIAPAYTFLMRNRAADVQFWLDVGSGGWWERIYQPLTHPYVLSNHWEPGAAWTDADEYAHQQDMLFRITSGLIRRCRRAIYLGISDLGEQGYEQHGPLLRTFQEVLERQRRAREGLPQEGEH